MLEGLEEIDWRALQSMGGEESIPRFIRQLTSADPNVREKALEHLFMTIWHQGDVYPATYHVVPFLIELLQSPSTPDRPELLRVVSWLMPEGSYNSARATRRALEAGLPTYLALLKDDDWETRVAASGALRTCCPGSREAAATAMIEALAVERDERVRLVLLLDLCEVPCDQTEGVLKAIIDSEPDAPTPAGPHATRPIRWAAAMSLTRIAREHAPAEAIRLVASTFADPGPLDEWRRGVPWYEDSSAVWEACDALAQAGAEIAVPILCNALAHGDQTDAWPVVRQLLQIIFPGFKPYHFVRDRMKRDAGSLDDRQRGVLDAILTCDAAWTSRHGLDRHLQDLGLPDSREGLRAFLEE